ncbi:glycosyl transferase [Lachnospiraceae bacterium WCA-9-b2]|uniref:Glycosyl transferase n=2 Tax=Sporofaciens musculi TaxID=2681861 RepID=A0A7X3ME60_9FIRM|nr:glycosyl transferase [Sporofaciens musculi]
MTHMFRFFDPDYLYVFFAARGLMPFDTDEKYLYHKFKTRMGYYPDLANPKTFNEKLQWLKLYDRKPEYTKMVDKYAVKEYVADKIGKQYIIPTLGVWDRFEDIDFDTLPNKFVLKCTHDSGGLVIVRDKTKLDKSKAKKKLSKSLRTNYYRFGREWPYKDVQPRIIAEKYMEDKNTEELRDYKFFVFNGVVKAMFIATDRFKKGDETKFDFFDMEYRHLPLTNGHPNSNVIPKKPETFMEMKQLASKIAENLPNARVDFYEVNGRSYFGEITFYHWSGMTPFEPQEWDRKFGDWITLPKGGGYFER